jgi:hypothetical protein
MHTFYHDGFYYTSPNAAYLPPVPEYPNPVFTNLEQLRQPRWISDRHPYLALLPISIRFSGDILFRFGYSHASIPVKVHPVHGQWALDPELMGRWKNIEGALHWLTPALHQRSQFGMQPHISPIAIPRYSGYMLGYLDETSARRGAMATRDAFIPKFCELSWALLMHKQDATSETPPWMATLIHDFGVHPEWAYALRQCVFGDFSNPENRRYGGFVDVTSSVWSREIDVLVSVGVPVWFRWPGDFWPIPGSSFSKYCPSYTARGEALRAASTQPFARASRYFLGDSSVHLERDPNPGPSYDSQPPSPSAIDLPSPYQPPHPASRPVPPPPEPYSGQRAGESMTDFFNRRQRAHERQKQVETPARQQIRHQREQAHSSLRQPGKRAKVYQWVDEDGFRIRTRVPAHEFDNVWNYYSDSGCIKYNGWDDEWDICTEFGEFGEPVYVYDPEEIPPWTPESPPLSDRGRLFWPLYIFIL